MAFLRLSQGRIRAHKHKARKADLAAERDEWLRERKRPQRAKLVGKTFVNKRAAAEYVFRNGVNALENGGKPREISSFKARGKASMANPKRFNNGAASDCVRVKEINGVWRRYVQGKDGAGEQSWRFASDHAERDDALAGRNALDDKEPDRSGKVAWQKIEG